MRFMPMDMDMASQMWAWLFRVIGERKSSLESDASVLIDLHAILSQYK